LVEILLMTTNLGALSSELDQHHRSLRTFAAAQDAAIGRLRAAQGTESAVDAGRAGTRPAKANSSAAA
jgi:hypothetical protein